MLFKKHSLSLDIPYLKSSDEEWRTGREMEEMLQYENSRRLELFRIIAHEMKTPVALIKGITELLPEHLVPEKQGYYLNKIGREAEQMDIMVADLLKDMKIASVGEKGIFMDIDLGKLLQELLAEMDISAGEYILKTEGSMVVEAHTILSPACLLWRQTAMAFP